MNNKKPLSLYVHIPYCKKKCAYCDFVSYANNCASSDEYCEAVIKELESYTLDDYVVRTVFFGGGTPSLLEPKLIDNILSAIYRRCSIAKDAEITVECNPCTINAVKLDAYKAMGINRLSIGVQSFDDELLRLIGRAHDSITAENSILCAKNAGFENINVDLMFAIPKQTEVQLIASLKKCMSLAPTHISLYSLILEDKTPLKQWVDEGKLVATDVETELKMYHASCELLRSTGYEQYEVSNFAKHGYESRHNTVYWERGEYIGLGCAAHSFFDGSRYENMCELMKYIAQANCEARKTDKQTVTPNDAAEELVMLGLRMNKGISEKDFLDTAGFDINIQCSASLDKLKKDGLIVQKNGRIYATNAGRDVLNYVILQLVSDFK